MRLLSLEHHFFTWSFGRCYRWGDVSEETEGQKEMIDPWDKDVRSSEILTVFGWGSIEFTALRVNKKMSSDGMCSLAEEKKLRKVWRMYVMKIEMNSAWWSLACTVGGDDGLNIHSQTTLISIHMTFLRSSTSLRSIPFFLISLQNLKNQIMTTNLWVEQVS